MGTVSQGQLQQAAATAKLSEEATKSVEQAGRGLSAVYLKCKANTADAGSIQALLTVQGHLNDAMRALLERESQAPRLVL